MKKAEWLALVTRDVTKYGHTTNETKELGKDIPCSDKVFNAAIQEGRKQREKIFEKHNYWRLSEMHQNARENIRRSMSCGDRLDDLKGCSLIDDYHKTMDVRDDANRKIDVELAAL